MNFNDETKLKRFKIIEPFLKKEKKLKKIESETGISYATLKRWIKSYKEKGVLGLEKKEREDKNSYKSIDETGVDLIKKIYYKEGESNLSKLYNNCQKYLKEKNYNISYPTFYRILNNIDGFFKKTTSYHLSKIKKSNEIFVVIETPLYIMVQTHKVVVPTLILMFDASTLDIINYSLNTEPTNIYSILGFMRESILKISSLTEKLSKPKEILLDSDINISKNISKKIFDKTNIKITNYQNTDKEIEKFVSLLKEDLYKIFTDKNKIFSFNSLETFLDSYIYLDESKYNYIIDYKILENKVLFRELDIFLQSTTRKVTSSSIRFKNNIFKLKLLEKLEGLDIEIKFNPINLNIFYLFFKNEFLGVITA